MDKVLTRIPNRQWVLTVPFPLHFPFTAYPELMSKVLGIVTRTLSSHLVNQAGYKKKDAHTGPVTLIQRFGSALNLNLHFRMLFLEDVYLQDETGRNGFYCTRPPTVAHHNHLLHIISDRVAWFLERCGILERGFLRGSSSVSIN